MFLSLLQADFMDSHKTRHLDFVFLRILAGYYDSATRPACQESSAVPGSKMGQRLAVNSFTVDLQHNL